MIMPLLFLRCNRNYYADRFLRTASQLMEFEWEVLDSAFEYLRKPRLNLDVDMVREMYEAVDEFKMIGDYPAVKVARAIFAAKVFDSLGEERLRDEDGAYRPAAVESAFADALRAGIATFDAQVGEESPTRERMLDLALGVKDRLCWQACMAWQYARLNEAIRAFPEPAFSNEKIPSKYPVFQPVDGILMNELWEGLLSPDSKRQWMELVQSMAVAASETNKKMKTIFLPIEFAEPQSLSELHIFKPPLDDENVEVSFVSVKGRMEEADDLEAIMEFPFLPDNHPANQPNSVVKVWDWCPWRDCVAAEAWISLENDIMIYAVAPYYCYDKIFVLRGLPFSAQVAFFPVQARIDTIHGKSRAFGKRGGRKLRMGKDFTYLAFASKNDLLSRAWYSCRALVEGVRVTKLWNGEEVLRLDLRMRDIPFVVPTYMHPSNVMGGTPKVGDAILMLGWFYFDIRQAKISTEEYARLYPNGMPVPEERVPGSLGSPTKKRSRRHSRGHTLARG